jgi:hypothetical protein
MRVPLAGTADFFPSKSNWLKRLIGFPVFQTCQSAA